MIVCSCAVISDHDIESALVDIMSLPNAPIPTPGVIYRHLSKKLNCCGCIPLTVEIIYAKMEELEAKGLVCPCACATARTKLQKIDRRSFEPKTARRPLSASVSVSTTRRREPA